jgi:hypothetical protein
MHALVPVIAAVPAHVIDSAGSPALMNVFAGLIPYKLKICQRFNFKH